MGSKGDTMRPETLVRNMEWHRRRLAGEPYTAIAKSVGRSPPAVRVAVYQAERALRTLAGLDASYEACHETLGGWRVA